MYGQSGSVGPPGLQRNLEKYLVGLFFRSDANPKALLTYDFHGNFGDRGLSL